MERLASGNVSYEIADALISENKITVELDADETIEGDIAIVGKKLNGHKRDCVFFRQPFCV